MSQCTVQTKEKFDELHRRNESWRKLTTLHGATVKAMQQSCAQLYKASEQTNKRLNQVLEEHYHCKRDRDYLDQDINKLFNIFQNMKPQPQGHSLYNPYQEYIQQDFFFDNKPKYSS
ncbi:hypothetical protein O181_054141 [Austropuccinia psidii MF-1]|uniref:Uncharacterized protein n=1 Tax=Austropuccinia psidii MF-1 TaxID=1389203 RepID=A0A9Q3E1X8_9BASI|nr:hypothetical protein [Austropuccinia psidii MF-1]